jgi:acyl carrier protein
VSIKVKNKIILHELELILKKKFNIKKKITPKTILETLQDWDSLKQLDFIMIIEKQFKIKFELKKISELKKIEDFIFIVKKK